MSLIQKPINSKLHDYKEINNFMKRVFPEDELIPMWLIVLLTKKKNHKFSAYYDNDLFVGVLYTIEKDNTVFVFYLAVNDKIHSKGYGSKLLTTLFEENEGKDITLFIETMDDKNASNYEQRIKRLAFYERNGFVDTKFKAGLDSPYVDILYTD